VYNGSVNDTQRNKALGERLRDLRSRCVAYRSLRQFAEAIGKSPSWLSKVERGCETPSTETLLLMCSLLDADTRYIFFLARKIEPEVENALLARYEELSPIVWMVESLSVEGMNKLRLYSRALLEQEYCED
jgi:transcriptional regulator with XRE-family HTH domain